MNGKGDRFRPVNQEAYGNNFENIFGKKELPREFKRYRISEAGEVGEVEEVKEQTSPFVFKCEERFNIGLGCMVANNAMAIDKKAKEKGLVCIGSEKLRDREPDHKKQLQSIFRDGIERLKRATN